MVYLYSPGVGSLVHLIESDTCDALSTVSPRFIVLIDIDLIVSAHR